MKTRLEVMSLVLLVLAVMATTARADRKHAFEWDDVTAADWLNPPDSVRQGATAVVLFERVTADESDAVKSKESVRTLYQRRRILGSEGRSWADIAVPEVSQKQRIADIQGRTILPDGTSIELDPATIHEKVLLKAQGIKLKQKTFSMPGVTDSCIIEFMVVYKTRHHAERWVFQNDIPLLKGEYRWRYYRYNEDGKEMPDWYNKWAKETLTPCYSWERTTCHHTNLQLPLEKPTEFVFTVTNVPAFRDEQFSPSAEVFRSSLLTYYGFDGLPIVFWSNASRRIDERLKEYLASSRRVQSTVAAFDTTATKEQRITAVYDWVQNHIVNGEYPDYPDAKALYEKHPAWQYKDKDAEDVDQILDRGYGTTFGINAVFTALLRAMGIDASLALATDRTDVTFNRAAKYDQFTRTLVITRDSATGDRFYAPGEPYLPAGLVPWSVESGTALVQGPKGELLTVPPAAAKATSILRAYQYVLDSSLIVSGTVITRWGGHAGHRIREELLTADEDKRVPLAQKEIAEDFPDLPVDSIRIEKLTDRTQPVQVRYTVAYKPTAPVGEQILLKPFDYCSTVGNPFNAPSRVAPISFRYAYSLTETVQLTIPDGWKVESLPADTSFANEVGSVGYHMAEVGAGLAIQRVFTLNQPLWSPEQYSAVQKLFMSRQDQANATVVLARTN